MGENAAKRIYFIDSLRGVVMLLMLLDHVRSLLFHTSYDPLDLGMTFPWLFYTRWITHFCAPVFVVLAGTSVSLSMSKGHSKTEMSKHLLVRGIWLILMELIMISPMWNAPDGVYVLQVMWAIGVSMLVLAAAIHAPDKVVVIIGVSMLLFHNVLDPFDAVLTRYLGVIWTMLHAPGVATIGNINFQIVYPLIPWVGVMLLGYQLGRLVPLLQDRLSKYLFLFGICMLAVFVLVRFSNIYGDPNPWNSTASTQLTLMSFVNCQKYPPSLLFLLMTLGSAFILSSILNVRRIKPFKLLETYGKVPLFFYLIHLPLIHLVGKVYASIQGSDFFIGPNGVATIYLVWLLLSAFLFVPCHFYWRLKHAKSWFWLKYL